MFTRDGPGTLTPPPGTSTGSEERLYDETLRPGALVGNYIVEELRAIGGFAGLYRARHMKLGRVVALKVLPGKFVKLVDFGIAKLVDPKVVTDGKITGTGVCLGTPGCMPPEQLLGLTVDARTDIYAAGVLLFELVTGRQPQRSTQRVTSPEHD